jgi:hypothetical protein
LDPTARLEIVEQVVGPLPLAGRMLCSCHRVPMQDCPLYRRG